MTLRRSERWKALERAAAGKLGGRRIHRLDFYESSPDVVVEDLGIIAECKAHKRFSFHRHLEQAAKYCRKGETPVLVTKEAGQRGEFCTVPLDWLADILDKVRVAERRAV